MACNEGWLEIMSAWHDGEATPEEVARARAHLPRCGACRTARARFQLLGAALRAAHRSTEEDEGLGATQSASFLARRSPRHRLMAGALVAAAAALLVIGGRSSGAHRAVVDELEARHLMAFARASPCEFESADPAAVRAWIASQFGHEIQVPAVSGARLLGARRCSLSGSPTVSLMYRRGDEPLSLFLPPPGTPTAVENVRLARARPGCTLGRLGASVCARPGLFAVARTAGTAMAGLESF